MQNSNKHMDFGLAQPALGSGKNNSGLQFELEISHPTFWFGED